VTTPTSIVRAQGEGDKRWFFGGGLHTWKATSDETGGELLAFEDLLTMGKATPLHCHAEASEAVYVLEGELVVQIDGVQHHLGAGGFSFAPRGVAHAFTVISPSARILTVHTPGASQSFFTDASEPTDQTTADGPVDFGRVRQAAQSSGATDILGPPPFEAAGAQVPATVAVVVGSGG
jgi:quercetin dioxygenase-like cupin family protein